MGERIEDATRAHHRRRLRTAGRGHQLDPPASGGGWAAGEPVRRDGCEIEVLIDGAQALPLIAEALEGARSRVHIAGWHLTPGFGLTREDTSLPLRDLLGEVAERADVRVLLWAGAPGSLFKPGRAAVRKVREELTRGTRVRCELDRRERPMHCHHEKLVIVDGEVAFVGGIDLTSLGGDRYDTSAHRVQGRLGWHDTASRLSGPAVADAEEHFTTRWRAVTGEGLGPAPAPAAAGGRTVQLLRTVPEGIYDDLPSGDFRILEAYTRALRSASRPVYLESQFLWSPEIVDILADKLGEPPAEEFRVLVLLPARPNNGADSTRGQLGVLAAADAGAGRFLAVTLSSRTGGLSGPLYVHSKLGLVDDDWLTVGSANLNDHSLFNDTEVNVLTCDAALARATRLRLWAEHLELPESAIDGEPAQVIDELWRPIASEQLERSRAGAPRSHRLCELPGVSRRSRALLGPLDGLLVDG